MESMPFICRRLATPGTGVLMVLLFFISAAGTCRAAHDQQQNIESETTGDVRQSPLQMDGMQREWNELLYHCRGLVPPRSVRRLGSEFLGKRSTNNDASLTDAAVQFCSDQFSQSHWLCTCLFPTDSSEIEDEPLSAEELSPRPAKRGLGAILLSGKRMNKQWSNAMNRRIMGSEFLGKRASPLGSEFLGKRARPLGSEFLGKRSVIPPSVGVTYNY